MAVPRSLFILISFLLLINLSSIIAQGDSGAPTPSDDDEEFSEFIHDEDEFPEREETATTEEDTSSDFEDTDTTIESDDEEFLKDEEEFEGIGEKPTRSKSQQPQLQYAEVPVHLASKGWEAFSSEILIICGLVVYAINFFAGRSTNSRLAYAWYESARQLLESNFAVVGDDGTGKEVQHGVLIKDSESIYSLWCTGKLGCKGMLVQIKLKKRHDLIGVMSSILKPKTDRIVITVEMLEEDMDSFVFAVVPKKNVAKLQKDLQDLSFFCPDKRSGEKYGLSNSYAILSEFPEIAETMLTQQVVKTINSFSEIFESLHFSDQYVEPKDPNEEKDDKSVVQISKKVLMFTLIPQKKGTSTVRIMSSLEPVLKMILFYIDRVRKCKLGKDAKQKAQVRRAKLQETYLKQSHAQRQEAAQQRREEKAKADKEKLLAEEDPDKVRKLQEKEYKKQLKKKNPKMKQMVVRGF
ncbi:Coiled-coil domain-containing protein 47 [Trichoplax sp. H2]|nr:Coiled-coil domain-containing protein 47 [Trichoplax sp. H2]|eukprot:RDD42671.1 Coiled-coil domain-containing protein 47 [Trichoplax sp. H2]